jgi:hypothetical protein
MPALRDELLEEADAFAAEWLSHFPMALRSGLGQRTAALLPCLMLARVDGKSPVEYLSGDSREHVRDLAIPLIAEPVGTIHHVIERVGP